VGAALAVRVLLVLVHLRTNPTTRAPAVLFATSQSAADQIIGHLVPTLASALRPQPGAPAAHATPWIIDGTLIPAHDQSITAPSKNYRRTINTQIVICSPSRAVVAVGDCGPGNRHDFALARPTIAHLITGARVILGDRGYRGIDTITSPARDNTGHIICDDHHRKHRRIRARVEHVITRHGTGRSCANAAAAARPSTTASTSSPDYGTSKPKPHRRSNN
jgi:Helix-turn-helix of DDE superfamily endonuclease/Transposase DDE domain